MNLNNMSVQQLIQLAKEAIAIAEDMQKEMPSYELAILNGVVDKSYHTTANGWIKAYEGEAVVVMEDGSMWKAVGHAQQGDAYYAKDGFIEFFKLEDVTV